MTKRRYHEPQRDLPGEFETRRLQIGSDIPEPVREYRFHPVREWRFDLAWPESKCALELDGGVFSEGRHIRPMGYTEDCRKLNAAAALGWTVLRYTAGMLDDDPFTMMDELRAVLER